MSLNVINKALVSVPVVLLKGSVLCLANHVLILPCLKDSSGSPGYDKDVA